jgi:Flp pilus assembly protein TadB
MSGLELLGLVAGVITAGSMGYVAFRLKQIPTNTELGRAVVGSIFWILSGTALAGVILVAGVVAGITLLAVAGAVLMIVGYLTLPRVARRWRRETVAIGEEVMATQTPTEPPGP